MIVAAIINNETWLICGGRDFIDDKLFAEAMSDLVGMFGMPYRIVHGAARGADSLADDWGRRHALEVIRCPANWQLHDKGLAGSIRNEDMLLKYKPSRVIAFPGGSGTADMVWRARKRVFPVIQIKLSGAALGLPRAALGL